MASYLTHADSLRWYLSGAGSNNGAQTDPNLSLGNYCSSTQFAWLSQSVSSPISNITIAHVSESNGAGVGTLTATGDDDLAWTPPGQSQGDSVTILNGEWKILEGPAGYAERYLLVTRTSATALTGTATVTLAWKANGLFDDVASAEATAGDDEVRALFLRNVSANTVSSIKVWLGTLGSQLVSGANQLGASGSGTIGLATGSFITAGWPDTGFCHIKNSGGTLREIVYYNNRTATQLTIPSVGRGLLGTSAGAGANTDLIDPVPGVRIAYEAPETQPDGYITDETTNGEGTVPGGLTWTAGITAATGLDVGSLAATYRMGIWFRRCVVVGHIAIPSQRLVIRRSFDAS